MREFLNVAGGFVLLITSVAVVTFLLLGLFASGPTGQYHVAVDQNDGTLVASVYRDMRFYPDTEVFRGPPAFAWQLYSTLTAPEPSGVQYRAVPVTP